MQEKQRAFLKWAGGKYRLAQAISDHLPPSIPQGACFVEPFRWRRLGVFKYGF